MPNGLHSKTKLNIDINNLYSIKWLCTFNNHNIYRFYHFYFTYLMLVHNLLFSLKDPKTSENDEQTNKPITSSKTVSDLEKAKSRAERFGVVTSNTDEKKAARAARFGISNNSKKIGKAKQ